MKYISRILTAVILKNCSFIEYFCLSLMQIIYEISKNTFLTEHLRTTASVSIRWK